MNDELQGDLDAWEAASDEDDLESPTIACNSIGDKIALVLKGLSNFGCPQSSLVVPTGDSGIAFEFIDGERSLIIEIDKLGEVETMEFCGQRLVKRQGEIAALLKYNDANGEWEVDESAEPVMYEDKKV